jgi:DNA-binding response OmpR family regulator
LPACPLHPHRKPPIRPSHENPDRRRQTQSRPRHRRRHATQTFDAIFLDINLGGENGLDYLSHLLLQPNPPPVIMFTSYTKDEVAEEARSRGAFDCLLKPFTLDDLREQLSRLRRHHGLPPLESR